MLENIEIMIESKEKILNYFGEYKDSLELLLNKDFFKQLLEIYDEMSKVGGIVEYLEMQGECDNCTERKRMLLRNLIFQMHESDILEIIHKIAEVGEIYEQVRNSTGASTY